ncbi:sporulation inhibitor of replication protein SirA [Halalkalibacterium halodurans]|nr:sporulation inhibitor of replication protein SirA [Halalkalibacterium halodurans]
MDAETTLFEALRKVRGAFFAIDVQRMRYGWLNPVRQVKLV